MYKCPQETCKGDGLDFGHGLSHYVGHLILPQNSMVAERKSGPL